jgi:hypothetical protein
LSDFFPIKGYSMNPVSLLPNLVYVQDFACTLLDE